MPASYNAHLSSMIPQGVKMTIDIALEESPDFKNAYEGDPTARRIINIAKKLEGNKRHASQHACFDKDTYVTTKQGLKKIIDIVPGDEVLTHKGRYKPVVDTIVTQADKIYNVNFYKAPNIKVTGNHPLYVRHIHRKGVRMANGRNTTIRIYDSPRWKSVHDLVRDDYVGIPINMVSEIPVSKSGLPFDLPEFWWVVGRFVSTGTFEKINPVILCSKTRANRITKDKVIEKIEACGFEYSIYNLENNYMITIRKNQVLADYLQYYGHTAINRRLTGDIFNLPVNMIKEFLDGFMSADHVFGQDQIYRIASASRELIIGIVQLVNKVYHQGAGVTTIPPAKNRVMGKSFFSNKKYVINFYTEERPQQKLFYEDGFIWVRFKSMTIEEKTQPMYNLTVLDDSSYVANGIAAHNCGIVLAPNPVSDFLPTSMEVDDQTQEKSLTSQVIMTEVEELSLIKMDLLGLKNLGVIHEVIDRIQENYGKDTILKQIGSSKSKVAYQDIPLTDRATYKMLADGLTGGVFQMESEGMTKLIGQMLEDIDSLPDDRIEECFERLIAAVALYRPGPMDYIPNYIAGMQDVHNIHYLTPELESILKPTYGVIVYQEQVMQIVQKLAGYSLGRADLVRKAMGKKKQKIMDAEKAVFIYGNKEAYESGKDTAYAPGCVANGIPENVAQEIWAQMADFAKYA